MMEQDASVSAARASIPSADLLTMSHEQILILDRMADDLGYPFRDIAIDCGMTEAAVRCVVHQFHAMGMTGYGPLYSEDGPGICGKGYWLSKEGFKLQRQMRALIGWRGLDAMRDAAQGMSTETAKTLQGAEGEACQPGAEGMRPETTP